MNDDHVTTLNSPQKRMNRAKKGSDDTVRR